MVGSPQLKTQNSKLKTLLFIAGDVSGDIHSALLVREVMRRHPGWTLHVVGGTHLQALAREFANVHVVGDTTGCGVIGFASVLALLPRVLQLRRDVLRFLQTHPVDGVVLCDWGAFNGRLLPDLKQGGIPVLYYFPPRSWQKTGEGGLGIVPYVARVATPFEWSAQRLQAAGCAAEWVGHPLLETVRSSRPRQALRVEFSADGEDTLIALLPGSRDMELRYIGPHLAAAAALLRQRGKVRFVVAVPVGATARARRYLPEWLPVVEGRAADTLLACDAAIVKSGTATLEAAVADAPQVVVYDLPPLIRAQWNLTGSSRKVRFVAMPNIMLDRAVVPELLGEACRAQPIAAAVRELLDDPARQARVRQDYAIVRRALGAGLARGATQRTAEIVDEMLSPAPDT